MASVTNSIRENPGKFFGGLLFDIVGGIAIAKLMGQVGKLRGLLNGSKAAKAAAEKELQALKACLERAGKNIEKVKEMIRAAESKLQKINEDISKTQKALSEAQEALKKAQEGKKAPKGVPPLRAAYEEEVRKLSSLREALKTQGKNPEEIARKLHQARRDLGVKYKDITPSDVLEQIHARNLEKHGDRLGPSIEWLRNQGKTWEEIAESATRAGSWPPK